MCLASAHRRRVVSDNTASHSVDEVELSQATRPRIEESGDASEIRHDRELDPNGYESCYRKALQAEQRLENATVRVDNRRPLSV